MEIKQAQENNLVDILFLLRQCIKDMHEHGLKQWNSANPSPEYLKEQISRGAVYMAMDLGMAKGMMNLTEDAPEGYDQVDWKSSSNKILYLKYFAVHPLWKDVEIGYQLITFAENYAKENGYSSIRLDVLDSYPIDEKFINTLDFSRAGIFHSEFQKKAYACFEKNM